MTASALSPAAAAYTSDRWRVALLVGLCVALGALRPLADTDLPMHLAVGRWIAEHGQVPRVEPFAWTRPGGPWATVSWGAQLGMYAVYAATGSAGLRVLNGLLLAAAAGAVGLVGQARRWPVGGTIAVAVLNHVAAGLVSAGLRPQTVMFALVPLAWALAETLARATGRRAVLAAGAGLAATAALAVNAHLYFPLVLAPLLALAGAGTLAPRRALAGAAAVALGWLSTPYAAAWPDVLRFLGTPWPLFRAPSPITELGPGFAALRAGEPAALLAVPLLALAWPILRLRGRERLVAAAYWAAGLLVFAHAVRGVSVWWLLTLPWAGAALVRLWDRAGALMPNGEPVPAPSAGARRAGGARPALVRGVTLALGLAGVAAETAAAAPAWRRERAAASRGLSVPAARVLDPLAAWLDTHAAPPPGARPRVLTSFAYGSYLTWRLAAYSASVDSRGSFPDSAVAPDRADAAGGAPADAALGPWRSADLAVVPLRWPLAAVLDTARGWRRVLAARAPADAATGGPADAAGLWVRTAWLARASAAGSGTRIAAAAGGRP